MKQYQNTVTQAFPCSSLGHEFIKLTSSTSNSAPSMNRASLAAIVTDSVVEDVRGYKSEHKYLRQARARLGAIGRILALTTLLAGSAVISSLTLTSSVLAAPAPNIVSAASSSATHASNGTASAASPGATHASATHASATNDSAGSARAGAAATGSTSASSQKIIGPGVGQTAKPTKTLVMERSFSITNVKVPAICETDVLKSACTRLVNYYARRFEREMVSNISVSYNPDDPFGDNSMSAGQKKEKSVQDITMTIYQPHETMLTMFSIFKQHVVGNNASDHLLVETINFEAKTGHPIKFESLFGNPQLAAMLCARAIESHYQNYNSPLLPVVVAATELSPSNFIITARGLRFFFAPGLVNPKSTNTDSYLVRLDALKAAAPIDAWWQNRHLDITDKQKQSLANSDLSGIINLNDNSESNPAHSQVEQMIQERRAVRVTNEAVAAIQGKSDTDATAAPANGRTMAANDGTRDESPYAASRFHH